jgi:hypothetical protein
VIHGPASEIAASVSSAARYGGGGFLLLVGALLLLASARTDSFKRIGERVGGVYLGANAKGAFGNAYRFGVFAMSLFFIGLAVVAIAA